MRFIAVLFACLLVPTYVEAKPSPYQAYTFTGDRYVARPVAQPRPVVRQRYSAKVKYLYRAKRAPRLQRGYVPPMSVARGLTREMARAQSTVIGGRPAGCPSRFCGCGASLHVFGRIIPHLNLAANWLRFPRTSPAPDMVAARRGHVFVLKRHIAGNTWLVFDANSGGRRTRIHPRSISGYSIVNPRA